MISVCFQGKPFNITLFQVCAPTTNAERSWSWSVLSRPRIPPRTNTKKDVLFIREDWIAKVGSQEIPGETGKFVLGVQNEPGQRLTEFCQKSTLVIANTIFQQHKKWLYIWTSPNGQYQNQIDYIFCSWRWRSYIQLSKTRPAANCGSDYQLLMEKFRLKLKKAGKTTRSARYNLNQIP